MNRFVAVIFALTLFFGVSSIASYAAENMVVDDDTGASAAAVYNDASARDRADAIRTGRARVYEWRFRPLDCGVYHYWNGAQCVDSRVVPPDIGPK